jgi:fused signal recognition particle receptor
MGIFGKVKGLFNDKDKPKEFAIDKVDNSDSKSKNLLSDKQKLGEGLKKTKKSFFDKLAKTVAGKSVIDDSILDDIEEALIASDIGVETTLKIIEKLESRVKKENYLNSNELNSFLKEEIGTLIKDSCQSIPNISDPYVIMVVGVNGVGKTTTIGKLANKFKSQGKLF